MPIGNKIINKGENNNFITTLYETNELAYPYYLCEFTSDLGKNVKYFICQDISTHSERYNEFFITETSGAEILTSGTITLNPTGQWSYRIFGQTSSTNLDPNNGTSILEIGQFKVIGTSDVFYQNENLSNQFIVNE